MAAHIKSERLSTAMANAIEERHSFTLLYGNKKIIITVLVQQYGPDEGARNVEN